MQLKKMMNWSLTRVLRHMIQIGQFYFVIGWVVPFHNIGMDHKQSESLWKCMVAPHLVDLHDIIKFVF
jgi:hypothetical protein